MSHRSFGWAAALPGIAVLCAARAAGAAELSAGDTAWMLTSSALVLMMTLPGLALFYGGLVRAKNVLSVLMQCAIAAALVGLLWVIAGYSLAFTEGNALHRRSLEGRPLRASPRTRSGSRSPSTCSSRSRACSRSSRPR